MPHHFKEEQSIEAIFFPGNQIIRAGGENCDRITVMIEQDKMVWFAVWHENNIISKWNAYAVEGVQLVNYEERKDLN